MKAVIVAGGKGTRISKEIGYLPKSLIPIKEKTLLGYQLDSLIKLNINDVILLTGYKSKDIQQFLNKEYPNLNVKLIPDPENHAGSYICSLARIKNLINDNVIFMHGDLIYEERLLKRLVENNENNLVLVHINPNYSGKDFKAKIKNNLIEKVSTKTKGNLLMPLYKFSEKSFSAWLKSINEFVDAGKIYVHAEEAIQPYSDKIKLKPLFYNKEFCMEIDTLDDLKKAEQMIK